MAALNQLRIAVIGAGVFGKASAWALVRAGAQVTLYDSASAPTNASRIAAGMLAPALEAALDPVSAEHFPILRAGRDGWAELLEGVAAAPPPIRQAGALFLGDDEITSAVADRLQAMGAEWCWATADDAQSLAPGQVSGDEGVFTPEDWLVSPGVVLDALQDAFLQAGGQVGAGEVVCAGDQLLLRGPEAVLEADLIVVATGDGARRLAPAVSELKVLSPIKGQILHYAAGPSSGVIVRTPAGYVAPQAGGAVVGATMEVGADDLELKTVDLDRMRAEAERLFPDLRGAPFVGQAGVRSATPDGLPLVGRSGSGVLLAVGARRNGWLLAPLVAQGVVAAASGQTPGQTPGPYDDLFAPDRFMS